MTDANDPLVPDQLEVPARSAEVVIRVLRDLALLVLAVAAAVAATYVARAAQDVSQWTRVQRENTIDLQRVNTLLDTTERVVGHVDTVTGEAAATLTTVRTTTIPRVNGSLDGINAATGHVGPAIDLVAARADKVLASVDGLIITADTQLGDRGNQLGEVLADLVKVTDHVVILTAPEQYEQVLADVKTATANLGKVSDHVQVISANAEEVSTFYKFKVLPQPYRPSGNFLLKGFKYTGHYGLQVLKAAPKLVVVGLQLLQ